MHPARPGWNCVRRSSNPVSSRSESCFRAKAMACAKGEHQLDAGRRTIDWFDRYPGSPR